MPAILAVSKGPQSQFRYCSWCRSNHGTDFDVYEIASNAFSGDWTLQHAQNTYVPTCASNRTRAAHA